nr:hypothetical protein CFP56_36326 [Quercus suber]
MGLRCRTVIRPIVMRSTAGLSVVGRLGRTLLSVVRGLRSASLSVVRGLCGTLLSVVRWLSSAGLSVVGRLRSTLLSVVGGLCSAGLSVVRWFSSTLLSVVGGLCGAGLSVVRRLGRTLLSVVGGLRSAGLSVVGRLSGAGLSVVRGFSSLYVSLARELRRDWERWESRGERQLGRKDASLGEGRGWQCTLFDLEILSVMVPGWSLLMGLAEVCSTGVVQPNAKLVRVLYELIAIRDWSDAEIQLLASRQRLKLSRFSAWYDSSMPGTNSTVFLVRYRPVDQWRDGVWGVVIKHRQLANHCWSVAKSSRSRPVRGPKRTRAVHATVSASCRTSLGKATRVGFSRIPYKLKLVRARKGKRSLETLLYGWRADITWLTSVDSLTVAESMPCRKTNEVKDPGREQIYQSAGLVVGSALAGNSERLRDDHHGFSPSDSVELCDYLPCHEPPHAQTSKHSSPLSASWRCGETKGELAVLGP